MNKRELVSWSILLFVGLSFIFLLLDALEPFIIGFLLAYLLLPFCRSIERLLAGFRFFGRGFSIFVTVVLIFFILIVLLSSSIPYLIKQGSIFIEELPRVLNLAMEFVADITGSDLWSQSDLQQALQDLATGLSDEEKGMLVQYFSQSIFSGLQGLFHFIGYLVIISISTIYLLYDYESLVKKLVDLIPVKRRGLILSLAHGIDEKISLFLRAQLLIIFLMSVYYSGFLVLIGLNNGFVIGIISGVMTFIPFLGAVIGLFLSVGFALAQFWGDYQSIILVLSVFIAGQLIEGKVLTPKIMAKKLALHPLYVLLTLVIAGTFFGFGALLIAIPVGAVIDVLLRRAVGYYMRSDFYNGNSLSADEKEKLRQE